MHRTPAFEAFISPAREDHALWRTIVTFLSGFVLYIFWTIILVVVIGAIWGVGPDFITAMGKLLAGLDRGMTPFDMAVLLATFIPMAGAAMLMVVLHGRSPMTLFGVRQNFLRNFIVTAGIIVAFNLIFFAYDKYLGANDLIENLPTLDWAGYLIWALPLLFIQITAEELVFRGYLLQQLAARFKSPIWWMVLPSVIFGLGHIDPTINSALALIVVIATIVFGIIAVDLTRITGNLGAAMGLHLANNFFALLVASSSAKMSGLALYRTSYSMQDTEVMIPLMGISIVMLIVVWLIARRVLR
ncbi:MAG: type II CAAX endopeptidase family protein [Litoreibacter sp.]|uniref:CPBP family intramembrane glutamic endopeptidase n=1 Tax=Litoreibacter sp. TaxID=1969459 RepID=UPI003297587A